MKRTVLSIDCGTQSIRGMIFDETGEIVAKEKIIYDPPYVSPEVDWAERDALLYWKEMGLICKKLKEKFTEAFGGIMGISVTAQRDSCVLVDKNGEPIRKTILWMDKRKISDPRPFGLVYSLGMSAVGMKNTATNFSKSCPAHWIMENEKDVWEITHKYLMLSAFLNYKLTGKFIDSISGQTGHMPLDYKKQRWEKRWGLKARVFQIPSDKLYDIVPAGTVIGYLTKEASHLTGLPELLPVIASGSDKACETLGVGCVTEEIASVSLGSQATIETTAQRYYEVQPFIPPFPAMIPNKFNPEINVYRGFWMVSWFKNEFAFKEVQNAKESGQAPEDLLNRGLRKIPPGSEGLMLQPFWGNELTRPESRGSIIGFKEGHTRSHIYRAIIEGIGYALKEGMYKIQQKSGIEIKKAAMSGGGAQSDEICQIMADILNCDTYRVQTEETSGLGAAISAFIGLGVYESFESAVDSMVHIKDIFSPDKKTSEIYLKLYEKGYSKIYRRLKPIYSVMEKIDYEDIDNS